MGCYTTAHILMVFSNYKIDVHISVNYILDQR